MNKSNKDTAFINLIRVKYNLTDLGINYFKYNFSSEYMIFSEAWEIQQKKIDNLKNAINLLESSNPVASQVFGKAAVRQLLKD